MRLRVDATATGHRLAGEGFDVGLVNRFLEHLSARNFATATRRAYAYDLLVFARFCAERGLAAPARRAAPARGASGPAGVDGTSGR